eukprot:3941272-Rhodomonas_salina.4
MLVDDRCSPRTVSFIPNLQLKSEDTWKCRPATVTTRFPTLAIPCDGRTSVTVASASNTYCNPLLVASAPSLRLTSRDMGPATVAVGVKQRMRVDDVTVTCVRSIDDAPKRHTAASPYNDVPETLTIVPPLFSSAISSPLERPRTLRLTLPESRLGGVVHVKEKPSTVEAFTAMDPNQHSTA